MKMRQRKVDLQARQLMGIRIGQLLDELDEAADLLMEAMQRGEAAFADDDMQDGETPAVAGKGESA